MAKGFISARGVTEIRKLPARGLQTALDLNAVSIAFHRSDKDTGESIDLGVKVVRLRDLKQAPSEQGGAGVDQQAASHRIRGFAPLDLEIGDYFTAPDGRYGVIVADDGERESDGEVIRTFRALLSQGAV